MDSYLAIQEIEVEVFLWSRGSTRVVFDFDQGILSWTETSRWNRNFARSLQPWQVDRLREALKDLNVLSWEQADPATMAKITDRWYRAWTIIIRSRIDGEPETKTFYYAGHDEAPEGFDQLRDVIRLICRQDFRVSE